MPKRGKSREKSVVCNLQNCMYPIVHRCVRERGWKIAKKGEPYDISISDNNQSVKALIRMRAHPRTLHPIQRVNHFPNMKQLYLKDYLAETMARVLHAMGPGAVPVAPQSWCLPAQRDELETLLAGSRETAQKKKLGGKSANADGPACEPSDARPVYIVKPAGGLQGHGIKLTHDPMSVEAVKAGRPMVVQHYIDPPLLIDGFKFDLRLYVLVLSVDPLKAYLYNDGLVRLCTTPYAPPTSRTMSDRNAHLTNYSLNKKSKNFVKGSNGSKRALKPVFASLKADGIDVDKLWADTIDVVNIALLSALPKIRGSYRAVIPRGSTLHTPTSTCYEILGFDVMFDSHLKPWLIEVNHAPSFRGGSKVDGRIKTGVLRQAFRLLKVTERKKRLLQTRCRKEWERYMFNQAGCAPPGAKSASRRGSMRASSALPSQRPSTAIPDADSAEIAALLELCTEGDKCVDDDESDGTSGADPQGSTGSACSGEEESVSSDESLGDSESGIGTDDCTPEDSTDADIRESTSSSDTIATGNDTSTDSDEDSDTEPEDAASTDTCPQGTIFRAPLPGTPDEYVRIFSGLSRSNRAKYASVIAAADVVYEREKAAAPSVGLLRKALPQTNKAGRPKGKRKSRVGPS